MKNIAILTLALSSLFLTACQTMQNTTTTSPTTNTISENDFQITGKIGIKTPEQSGSAFIHWTQQSENFSIQLSGALGIGQTQIFGTPQHATLISSKTGEIQANNAEELLYRATGWQAPVTGLISWINGKAHTAQAQTTKDELNRIKTIQELGWQAQFSYQEQQPKPQKLIIEDDTKQYRITLVIQNRQ